MARNQRRTVVASWWWVLACLFVPIEIATSRAGEPLVLEAERFGLAADGVTDDGPAIRQMLDRAAEANGPVVLRFPSNRSIYVATAAERYVLPLDGVTDWTIDGGGSTFSLHPHLRMLRLTESRNVELRRLRVDFRPLPFADATVVAVDTQRRFIEARLHDAQRAGVLGGPTGEDGEQAYFSMLWHEGPYALESRHLWTERVEPGSTPDTVRIYAADRFRSFAEIEPGRWQVSLPVPGIAHRAGPGACFHIRDNKNVAVEDVELWSAPWFGFHVARNEGQVTFRRVCIRPRPRTERIMSLWRDGFHVKGNRASLLWEDCVVTRMNDDAFNISTHTSVVDRMESPTRIELRQKFPLIPMPWREDAVMIAADEDARRLLGSARITRVETGSAPQAPDGKPRAPKTWVELDRPIEGLGPGTMVWDPASSNPDTTLRRCRIERSCRMQSPMTLEDCDVAGLLWFYGGYVEGPFPSHVTVRNCRLQRARGNPTFAVIVSGDSKTKDGPADAGKAPRALHDFRFEENEFWGGLSIKGAEHVILDGNTFHDPDATILLEGNFDCAEILPAVATRWLGNWR